MATQVVATAAEYLVKLGVNMDTANMAKFESFMNNGKVQAAALSAALVALSKAVYSFVKTQTEYEQSLVELSKEKAKNIAQTRAEQNALKALGKTLNEIEKDDSLNSIYKDLVKIGQEIQMPDMKNVLASVESLKKSFYELKYVVQYAMQWMNYYILKELQGPMGEISNVFTQLKDWLKANMQSVSRTLGLVIGDLGRGITGILKTISTISDIIGKIPKSVQLIGAAFLVLKSGPLGMILTAITMVGDLIKDYENWQWKNQNKNLAGTEEYDNLLIGLPELWEAIDKASSVTDKIESGLDVIRTLIFGENGNLFTALSGWLTSEEGTEVVQFGQKIWGWISQGIKTANNVASEGVAFLLEAMGFSADGTDIAGNELWGIAGTTLIKKLLGVKDKTNLLTALGELFAITDGDLATLLMDNEDGTSGPGRQFVESLWSMITKGLQTANHSIADLVSAIFSGLNVDTDDGKITAALQGHASMFGSIGTTIMGFIFGGTAGGFTTLIANTLSNITSDFYKVLTSDGWKELSPQEAEALSLENIVFGENGIAHVGNKTIKKNSFADELLATITVIFEGIKTAFTAIGDYFGPGGEGEKVTQAIGRAFADLWKSFVGGEDESGNKTKGIIDDFAQLGMEIVIAIASQFENLWTYIYPYLLMAVAKLENWFAGTSLGKALQAVGLLGDGSANATTVIDENGNYVPLNQITAGNGQTLEQAQVAAITRAMNSPVASQINSTGEHLYNIINPVDLDLRSSSTSEKAYKAYDYFLSAGDADSARKIYDIRDRHYNAYMANKDPITGWIDSTNANRIDTSYNEQVTKFLSSYFANKIANAETNEEAAELEQSASDLGLSATDLQTAAQSISEMTAAGTAAFNNLVASWPAPKENAWGGRFDHEMHNMTVGEDGTEYIIPITKPKRAASLVKQMVAEMGSTAANDLLSALGVSNDTSTYGGSVSSISSATSPVINYTVNATTTINVQGTGSAEDIGVAAYNAHERYLVRTLRGVLA